MKKNFTGDSKRKGSDWVSVSSVLIVITKNTIKKIDNTLFKKIKSTIKKLVKTIRFLFMRLSYLTPVNFVVSRIRGFSSSITKILKRKDGTSQR